MPLTVEDAPSSDEAASPPSEVHTPRQTSEPAAPLESSLPAAERPDAGVTASSAASGADSQPPSPQTPAAAEVAVEYFPITETSNSSPLSAERLEQPVLARFLIPDNMSGFLIGNKGEKVVSYKERSGAKVWVSSSETSIPGAGMR